MEQHYAENATSSDRPWNQIMSSASDSIGELEGKFVQKIKEYR